MSLYIHSVNFSYNSKAQPYTLDTRESRKKMTRSIVSSVDLPSAYCSGSFVLLGRMKAWPGSVKLNKVFTYLLPVFDMHGQWIKKFYCFPPKQKRKKVHLKPEALMMWYLLNRNLIFLFILLIYICCINHLGCVVSNNETKLKMSNREGRGNDCGLFYAVPRSAWRENPLKISGWTLNHSATCHICHIPVLINEPPHESLEAPNQ